MNGRVVALTGATGFLGAHVAAALIRAGANLRILTHRQPPHPLWRDLPTEIFTGSVTDAQICTRFATGADVVVHAAGLIKSARKAAFAEVNMQGTANMARASQEAGCRLVLISSLAAREPLISPYATSKREGEFLAQSVFSETLERLVILRPPAIYGPWDRETLVIFKAASNKVAPVFGTGRNAIMHVRDAAAAITQVTLGTPITGCFALTGPDLATYTVRELLQAAAIAVGNDPYFVQVPAALFRFAGAISGLRARLRGVADIFTADKARELLNPDWTVALDEALPVSISQPMITLNEGFRETAGWYKTAGWLP